jgi:hypothetical protein
LPADSEYILIDTVQVDILPSENYSLPFAYIYIGTQNDDPKKNVLFISDSTFDKSTRGKKYLWDFGDNALHEGRTINRKLEKVDNVGVESIFHRVVDQNGFIADAGFVAEKSGEKLQFTSFSNAKISPISVGTYQQAAEKSGKAQNKLSIPQFLIAALAVFGVIGCIGWWLFKKANKRNKKRK